MTGLTNSGYPSKKAMAPSFLNFKDLRRRSRASFRTDRSTDGSSDASQGTTPTTGSLTPPSLGQQSDPALHLQVKDQVQPIPPVPPARPPLPSNPNGAANRYSVSGMAGLGSPTQSGRGSALPVSQFSPRITNVPDNSWVSRGGGWQPAKTCLANLKANTQIGLSKGGHHPRDSWGSITPVAGRNSHRQPARRRLPSDPMAYLQLSF